MKKLVFSACALTLTGSTAVANDSDWAQLDKDVQALSASFQDVEGTGMTIGGRVRAFYENSGDIVGGLDPNDPNGVATNDLGGFALYNARLFAYGTTGSNVSYRLEHDFAGNNNSVIGSGNSAGRLLDAYLTVSFTEEVYLRAGQFRAQVLRESLIDSGDLMFVDRTQLAALFAGRRNGIAVGANFDAFEIVGTLQNGGDDLGDSLFFVLHGRLNILGGGTQLIEGAYGGNEEMDASIGVAYFNDDAINDADGITVEGNLSSNLFWIGANVASFNDGLAIANLDVNERQPGLLGLTGTLLAPDSTPWSIAGSFMLTQPDSDYGAWEIGARYQDMDDPASTRIIDVGANYYVDGHNMKYQLVWTQVDTDIMNTDVSIIRVGMQSRF
ncbi:MAG: porin [Planctomycetota bacterium]